MSPNDLLEEEDRYRWYILQIIEMKRHHFLSINELMDTLGISKYRTIKYLEDVLTNCRQFDAAIEITVEPNGEVYTKKLNSQILKQVRLFYLERSLKYQILLELLTGGNSTVDVIAAKLYLSRSKAYAEFKELKKMIEQAGFHLKSLKIKGDEIALRTFVYWLLFEFYSGIKSPFTDQLAVQIFEVKSFFLQENRLYLTSTEEIKLDIYLGVSLMRIQDKCVMPSSPVTVSKQFQTFPSSFFKRNKLDKQKQEAETTTFLFFCYVEKIVSGSPFVFNPSKVEEIVKEITEEFLTVFGSQLAVKTLTNQDVIKEEISRINRKWLYFHFRDTTFISANQRTYFQEVYPTFDRLISQFIDKLAQRDLFHSKEEMTKVYYDYLFLLIGTVDANLLEKPIYICIDFSHGTFYDRYIENNLKRFDHSNIIFENKLSGQTQIYISDFVMTKLKCEQVVWKNPPSAGDWKDFGDLLIRLKRLNNE